ncbi:hypothetical protein TNCV_532151 [Trichonephila clavipes]|nr:hypothetical protein TNCV_532151 [Trichonephila clavipes]
MAVVGFLHHENPPTWAGVEPTTLGAEGQRQTHPPSRIAVNLWINLPGPGFEPEKVQSNALPTRLSGLVANYACGIAPLEKEDSAPLSFCSRVFILERVMGPLYDSLGGISSVSICSAGSWYGFIRSTWTTSLSFLFREAGSKYCTA